MAKSRSRNKKKETVVKITDKVEVKDVPVVDDMIIEDKAAVSADGFVEDKVKEEKIIVSKETKVEEAKPEDGLVVEKTENKKTKKVKVIKKVHNHGGNISV